MVNKIVGRKPKLTREQYAWLLSRHKARSDAGSLLADAKTLGVSKSALHKLLRDGYKHYRL